MGRRAAPADGAALESNAAGWAPQLQEEIKDDRSQPMLPMRLAQDPWAGVGTTWHSLGGWSKGRRGGEEGEAGSLGPRAR